jgi:hypothetical protein
MEPLMYAFDREELLGELYGTSRDVSRQVGGDVRANPVMEHLKEVDEHLSSALAQLRRGRDASDASVVSPAVGGLSSLGRSFKTNPLWFECSPVYDRIGCTDEALRQEHSLLNVQLDVVECEGHALRARVRRALVA